MPNQSKVKGQDELGQVVLMLQEGRCRGLLGTHRVLLSHCIELAVECFTLE